LFDEPARGSIGDFDGALPKTVEIQMRSRDGQTDEEQRDGRRSTREEVACQPPDNNDHRSLYAFGRPGARLLTTLLDAIVRNLVRRPDRSRGTP
jgi:hypothetical protein